MTSKATGPSTRLRVADPGAGHPVALVFVDVINDFDFPGSESLIEAARRAAPAMCRLAARARKARVPVLYVNDNFGHWRSDFRATFQRCSEPGRPGADIARQLEPQPEDVFVLKPMHSGFFHTPLDLVLQQLETKRIVLCGFATNLCVAFTAYDAYMRGLHVSVPSDTTAANSDELCAAALKQLETSIGADVAPSDQVDFERER